MLLENNSLEKRRNKRQLLVENKLTFNGPDSELSIYDTYRAASGVGLDADQLMYCGMVQGKKVMHDFINKQGEVFLPHESYVMPPGGHVEIDFPEAKETQPTTCLTIEIPKERIETISERMQDLTPIHGLDHDWGYQPHVFHKHHTADTQHLLERLVSLFTQNDPDKEIMVDLGISELIIKLLREQGRDLLLNYSRQAPDSSGLIVAINFIEQNIALPLDVEQLCRKACMSRSRLYIEFKKQLGCSPGEYQQQRRLNSAADYLKKGKTVTETCYEVGFNDLSHFSRRFAHFFGRSPRQFRNEHKPANPV
ncbi:MAG: AraC family transcriptional regulator [Gammaproteobacteria bacterium]